MPNDRPERRQVHYAGRVQGVGFRYTSRAIAERFNVTGYVRNLDDCRVLLVAEGDPAELDRFLEAIERQLGRYINTCNVQVQTATSEFHDFGIHH